MIWLLLITFHTYGDHTQPYQLPHTFKSEHECHVVGDLILKRLRVLNSPDDNAFADCVQVKK